MADMKTRGRSSFLPDQRPKKMNNFNITNIFSTTLRDAGEIALIDGDTKKIISVLKDRLRRAHFAHVRIGPLPVRDRPRCQGQHDRPVDGKTDTVAEFARAWKRALGRAAKSKGFKDKYAIAGTYWPPQFVIMDGDTLKPEDCLDPRQRSGHAGIPPRKPRVASIVAATSKPGLS